MDHYYHYCINGTWTSSSTSVTMAEADIIQTTSAHWVCYYREEGSSWEVLYSSSAEAEELSFAEKMKDMMS